MKRSTFRVSNRRRVTQVVTEQPMLLAGKGYSQNDLPNDSQSVTTETGV